jgi:hypothetical protein
MANPKIETYRGPLPRCKHCGADLKPNYETVKERVVSCEGQPATGYSGRRKVYIPREEQATGWPNGLERLKQGEAIQDHVWGTLYWDKRAGRLYRIEKYARVLARRFLGTFGVEGCNYFCSERCGFTWACRQLGAQEE